MLRFDSRPSGRLSPLSVRLVAATVAFSTLIALIATAVQLYVDYRGYEEDIQATFEQVDRSYLPTIANALWGTNHQELQVAINGLVRLPDVRYVQVTEGGRTWAEAGQPKTDDIQSKDYPLVHLHKGESITVGYLKVVVDMRGVYQRLLDTLWVILLTNTVKTFIVAGFMLWLFRRLVTRHVRRIAEHATNLGADNLHHNLALDRPVREGAASDEFDLVREGFVRMQSNLAAAITALRESEAHVVTLHADLERRVLDRTAELEAANLELEAFSYSVSHDLRAPLRGIDGFSQALSDDYGDRLDPVGLDYLQRVRAAAQRMGVMIDAMLRLARLSREKMHVDTVDLSLLANDVVADLMRMPNGRVVSFRVQPGLVAYGDSVLLRIAIENLLDNAFKYSSKVARADIEFAAKIEGGQIVYWVRDNGAGFDMAHTGKLFGVFQRLHRDDEFPGTGVGLATVKRIIQRHGGQIWVESRINAGSTFYFTLGALVATDALSPKLN